MELADYASESIILYGIDGTVQYCNHASETVYGWTAATTVGRHFASLTQVEDKGTEFWSVLLERQRWQGVLKRYLRSGDVVSTHVQMEVRHDALGNPVDVVEYSGGVAGNAKRPFDKKPSTYPDFRSAACWQFNIGQAQAMLKYTEPALDHFHDDPEWHQDRLDILLSAVQIMDVNQEAMRLFGLLSDRNRLIGRPIANLWPEQSHAILADLLTAVMQKTTCEPETREMREVGPLQDVVLTGLRAPDSRGTDTVLIYVNATLNAPSALLELEESQNRYRNMIASLPIPVWQVDARAAGRIFDRLRASGVTDMETYSDEHPEFAQFTSRIVHVSDLNQEAITLFGGKDRSEFIGPCGYLFSGTPGLTRRVMLAHFAGIRNYVEKVKVKTLDGRMLDVLLLITFPVQGERLDTTIIMMIDNTARLEAEAKLRQVEADFTHAARLSTLGEMTTSIAHEIKQPLSAILMNAQTSLRYLLKAEPNVEKASQLTSRIVESAQRAADIIGRIQDMAGNRSPSRIPINLNDVIRQCLIFLRHESEDKAISFKLDLNLDLPKIHGDRVQLQQIIVNLIVNSIQAMNTSAPTQREIYLNTWLDDDMVVFSIRDTGTGIPDAHIDKIFNGFFTTKEGGLGIGLAICQTIVEAHGGKIVAANDPEGGAIFRFWLPCIEAVSH